MILAADTVTLMSSRPHGWRRVEECAPVLSRTRDLVTNFLLQQWLHFHPHVASQPLCVPRAPNKPSLCCQIPLHCHSKLNLYFSRKPSARSLLYELIGRWNMDLSAQRKLRANNRFSLTQLQQDGIDKHPSRNQKITPLRLVLVKNMLKPQS